jgi:hypothetical protein
MSPVSRKPATLLAFVLPLFLLASAALAVTGNTLNPSGSVAAGSIFCTDPPIGLDNSTYVTYNTYGSASGSVKWSVWYGTNSTNTTSYTKLFALQGFAFGASVNQTAYPVLTGFPLYFITCLNNDSGSSVSFSICASNQTSCP